MRPFTAYLFDWGDTLMVDFPRSAGKMCDWETVRAVDGAKNTLEVLARTAKLYVATNAAESGEQDIRSAFKRVGLDRYIAGVFCKANLGLAKGSPEFLRAILERLPDDADQVAVVGDSLEKDIVPALGAGLGAFWLTGTGTPAQAPGAVIIRNLGELCNPEDPS